MMQKKQKTRSLTNRDELSRLLKSGTIGFFNCVEITEIFAFPPGKEEPVNLYTLIVAEENQKPDWDNRQRLFKWLKSKGLSKWKFGITSYICPLDEVIDNLVTLTAEGTWTSLQALVPTPKYDYVPKKFVPQDSFKKLPLNNILKNNFLNGSYILEWRNTSKSELSPILNDPPALQEISKSIQDNLPIKLASMSDKLGNIIFQIPSEVLRVSITGDRESESISGQITWHSKATPRGLIASIRREDNDDSLDDFSIIELSPDEDSFHFECSHGSPYKVVIFDKGESLMLFATAESSFIKTICFSGCAMEPYNRVFTTPSGSKSKIQLQTVNDFSVGDDENVEQWARNRIYKNEKETLKNRREFIQYNSRGRVTGSKEQALKDIRMLIAQYGQDEVCLWDPYLNSQCVLDTLFHNPTTTSVMKAITDANDFTNDLEFLPDESTYGLNLEIRRPYADNGWKFHDRFLIFPKYKDGPVAWSLGTSINGLGKDHHILQKVGDGQLISDAFDALWQDLQVKNCLVWQSNN